MKKESKKKLSKTKESKVVGGATDDLDIFNSVNSMTSVTSIIDLNGEEFLTLKGKTHRNEPIDKD